VADPAVGLEVDPEPAVSPGPQLGEDARALEQELDGVAREVPEEARGRRQAGHEARQVLLAQRERQPVVFPRVASERLSETAEASKGEGLLLGRLELPPRDEPEEIAGGVLPRVPPVPAGEEHDHGARFPLAPRERGHEAVPLEEAGGAQAPVPEGVALGAVGAGEVDDEAGAEGREHRGQGLAQDPEIALVPDPRAEGDGGGGDGRRLSPVLVVEGVRVDARVVGEDGPGAVAVVEVEVDHEHGVREAPGPEPPDRHRDVVEHAEAQPRVRHRVMETAAEVDGDPARLEGEASCLDGAPDRQALVVDRGLRLARSDGHPEDAGDGLRFLEPPQVVLGVHAQQVRERGRSRRGHSVTGKEPSLAKGRQDLLAAQGVEGNAEDPALVARVVHERQAPAPETEGGPAQGSDDRSAKTPRHRLDSPTPEGPRPSEAPCWILVAGSPRSGYTARSSGLAPVSA
jgi:hypothetical protein